MNYNKNSSSNTGNQDYSRNENTKTLNDSDISFYKNNELDPELFNEKAQIIANTLAACKDANNYSQLRRFYDEVVGHYERLSASKGADFALTLPLIKMINAQAAYALGRKKVDRNFQKFIQAGISQINDFKSFIHFKTLFESVMGFLKDTVKGNK
jgi:CRISPR type III-A-associated protein Csm2